MRHVVILLSGLLLVGCASLDLESEKNTSTPAVAVITPFKSNSNALALATQLQADYQTTPIQVWRVGNEVKVTYPSDVLFGVGGDVLLSDADGYLDSLVKAASAYPGVSWRVDVFTDNSGAVDKNQMHTEARAEVTALYLINQGVASDHITYKGYGSDAPIAENSAAAGRAVNRRVVITISSIPVPQSAA